MNIFTVTPTDPVTALLLFSASIVPVSDVISGIAGSEMNAKNTKIMRPSYDYSLDKRGHRQRTYVLWSKTHLTLQELSVW